MTGRGPLGFSRAARDFSAGRASLEVQAAATSMSDPIRETLQLFWEKNVKRISPGALGMTLQGTILDDELAQFIAQGFSFARWENGWIILDREPIEAAEE